MCIVQIDLTIHHIQFLFIGIVQMNCLTKHDFVVSYIPLDFDEIQISLYSSSMWSIRFVNLYVWVHSTIPSTNFFSWPVKEINHIAKFK
jgi:hypothetical protein